MSRKSKDRRWAHLAVLALTASACAPDAPPYVFQVAAGTYADGSAATGLAALMAVRDPLGQGPQENWSGVVERGGFTVAQFEYADPNPGSYSALKMPEVPVSSGSSYDIRVSSTERTLKTELLVTDAAPLAVPSASLSSDGARLSWPAVPGAAVYTCEVLEAGAVQLRTSSSQAQCDVSALPAGTFLARVTAMSFDPEALRGDSEQTPAMPVRFDVSQSRVAFVRSAGGGPTLTLTTAGGPMRFGGMTAGFAVWLSLTDGAGVAVAEDYAIEVHGPGLPSSAPLRFIYPAGVLQHLVWSYDVAPTTGQYSLIARGSAGALSATFPVSSDAPVLPLPANVRASPHGTGGADASWDAVVGAGSYYVGVWTRATGAFVTGRWVTGTSTRFAVGTFSAGIAFDVYVAAASLDMTAPTAVTPTVSVSENTAAPAGFTAL